CARAIHDASADLARHLGVHRPAMARRRRNGLARRNKFEEISSSRLRLGKAWNCRAKAEPESLSNQSGTIRPGNWRRDMSYCADGAATARLSLSAPKISTPARGRLALVYF